MVETRLYGLPVVNHGPVFRVTHFLHGRSIDQWAKKTGRSNGQCISQPRGLDELGESFNHFNYKVVAHDP